VAILPQPILEVIESLSSLPGIGPKSASRLAFHLLRLDDNTLKRFGTQIQDLKNNLVTCQRCQNIASNDPCDICRDSSRNQSILCIIEDALDVVALEKAGHFKGHYHVLHGLLSPIDGIGPAQLKIAELEKRLQTEKIQEVILALNPTVEGEATVLYLTKRIGALISVKITRLAHGLPVGADLEYADEITLARALEGRRIVKSSE